MGDLTPITREEYYLARMAGEDVTMPEPITREEEYMKGIAAQIEAGSTELPAVTDADEGKILAVNANGKWDKADAPSGLPEVTASDNGDILTVVDGAWAKAASESLVRIPIHISPTNFPSSTISASVTFERISDIIESGKTPVLVDDSVGFVFKLCEYYKASALSNESYAKFEAFTDYRALSFVGAFVYWTINLRSRDGETFARTCTQVKLQTIEE